MKHFISLLLVLLLVGLGAHHASADSSSIDWTSVELSKTESVFTGEMDDHLGLCRDVGSVDIVSHLEYMNGATLPNRGCIIKGKDVDMFVSLSTEIRSDSYNFAIRTKPNGKFYFLKPGNIADAQHAQLVSGTNMYVEWRYTPYESTLVRTMDIRNAIVADKFDSTGNPILYKFVDDGPAVKTRHFTDTYMSGAFTKDGKFLFWSANGWLYRTNLETGARDIKYMPGQDVNWQNMPYYSYQIYPADPEGRYVYLGGKLDMLVDTVNDCGQYYIEIDNAGMPEQMLATQTNCKMRSFKGVVNTESSLGTGVLGVKIEGSKLQIGTHRVMPDGSERFMVEFSPEGLSDTQTSLIDYLALGDSYSSGEGDVAASNYYIKGTDGGGQCHLSSRSYPYTLAYLWGYQKEERGSVACSGAMISADYTDSINTYQGQHKELAELSVDDRQNTIDKALADIKPGIIPQIEFVKKYKPSVVTLTGGGNDVGFVKVLQYCAGDIKETATNSTHTCEYVDGGKLHKILNDSIDTQYGKIKELIQKIKTASPGVKIYYIGYPSFIAGSDEICGYNNGALNAEERNMINQAVKRLNHTIKQAAASEDIQYIDVEEALDGGRLCESEKYITGILDDGALKPDHYGAFHPNAAGHTKITEAIITQVPRAGINYAPTVSDPNIITIEPGIPTERGRIVKDTTVAEGEMLIITLEPNTSAASTDIIAAGFSSPTQLGVFRSSTDGSLNAQVKLPSTMSEGQHLLLLEFIDPGGKKKRLYEFIEVSAASLQRDKLGDVGALAQRDILRSKSDLLISNKTENLTRTIAATGANNARQDGRRIVKRLNNEEARIEVRDWSLVTWIVLGVIITGGVWVYGKERR